MPSIAPEVIFHDVDRSQWVEDYIAERLEKLERFAQGITRCHVTGQAQTEVRFSPEQGEDGLQASSVQVIGKRASI